MKKKIVVLSLLTSSLASCGMIVGTPSGVREFNRGAVGLASIEKQDTPFHELERTTEKEKTIRISFGGSNDRGQ